MPTQHRRLVVVGQGYVGLPLAMRAVEVGFDVTGYEIDPRRVARLSAGDSYVEDISDERARRRARQRPLPRHVRSRPTSHGFDIAVITVPTPLRDTLPDLQSHRVSGAHVARRR